MQRQSKNKPLTEAGKCADLLLLLLYLAVVAVILFRVQVESTGYLSPDSRAYLGLAQSLKDGHGFYVLSEHDGNWRYFTIWPVGYPVLIFILAKISGLSVFWASKVLNLLLLGCGFLLLRKICRSYAFVLASVYGAYTLLEIYSFTWSEAPFLLGILLLAFFTDHALRKPEAVRYVVYIFLTCLFLFLIRYVGAFSFSIPALLGLYHLFKRKTRTGILYSIATVLLALLAGSYLYINYQLSGYTTGFNRLEAETESIGSFLLMLAQGLANEFFIIRKFRSASQPDYLFFATAFIQTAVLLYIYNNTRRAGSFVSAIGNSTFALSCFAVAGLYFAAILTLRHLSHFDDLDYRLLSPVTMLVIVALVYTLVTLPEYKAGVKHAKYAAFAFFVLSLFLNLPKEFILTQLKQIL